MEFIIFVVNFLFSIIYILLALKAIIPWLPEGKIKYLASPLLIVTDPFLSVIRKGLPPLRIGMDVSPFIAIILLWILHRVILACLS